MAVETIDAGGQAHKLANPGLGARFWTGTKRWFWLLSSTRAVWSV